MKILIDSQILISQKHGGISRYFFELAKRYNVLSGVSLDIPVFCSKNYYFEEYFKKKSCNKYFPKTTKAIILINRMKTCNKLSTGKYNIFHPSYFSNYFLNNKAIKSKKTKLIITVYDMIYELMPEYFSNADKVILRKKNMIFAADKIIAISESAKKDILKLYPEINENKIKVIHLASSMIMGKDNKADFIFDKNFILFVGSRVGYKNFDKFIEAFSYVNSKMNGLNLLCVGGGAFSETEINRLNELGILQVTKQATLSDNDLSLAYQNAFCFVFPSLYEGFGIPVLEAFENGCPALLANASSLPEVGGDAAIYFDPNDSNQIAKCILSLNEEKRKEMINSGKEQYKKFSWDKCASETIELYKELL